MYSILSWKSTYFKDEKKINFKVPMSKKKKNQFPRFYPASPGTSCPTRGHPRSSLGVANTKVLVAQCVRLFVTPWTAALQTPLLQARILQWVAIPFSRGSSQPRNQSQVSCITDGFFTTWATREAQQSLSLGKETGLSRETGAVERFKRKDKTKRWQHLRDTRGRLRQLRTECEALEDGNSNSIFCKLWADQFSW